tara:strand:+ start:20841 stop:20999 length:159 start_codon:yes stop_codon:yes gene_type:complete
MHDNGHFEHGIYAVAWEKKSKSANDENHSLRNGLFPKFGRCLKVGLPNDEKI